MGKLRYLPILTLLPTLTQMHTRMQTLTIAAHELNPSKLDLPSMKSRFAEECMLWLCGRSCGVLAQRGSYGCPSSTHYQSVNIYTSTSLLSNHHTIDHVRIEEREEMRNKTAMVPQKRLIHFLFCHQSPNIYNMAGTVYDCLLR